MTRRITSATQWGEIMKTLNDYAQEAHAANIQWWQTADGQPLDRNRGELLMLIVSEIAEAMEGMRKGSKDDHLPHRDMEEVELADTLIRIFDYAGAFGIDLEGAYREKMDYNAVREDHKHEARQKVGGKSF
jgi:NTP pyrophosphatase (non-canonical NTP hydrolase)